MTNQEYSKLISQYAKPSPLWKNLLSAFLVGGLICVAGQWLLNFFQNHAGLDKEQAGGAVSVTLIFAAALLTGLGGYDKLAKFAGAGSLVPITGFSNAMVSPVLEFKSETILQGTCAKMFTIAGPVIVLGLSASVVYGLVLILFGLE